MLLSLIPFRSQILAQDFPNASIFCSSGDDPIINVHCSGDSRIGEHIKCIPFLSIHIDGLVHCTAFHMPVGVQPLSYCAEIVR